MTPPPWRRGDVWITGTKIAFSRFSLILIDTCVWLDLAKDYYQRAILAALEALVRQGDVALILPRTVVDEFSRNKAHVIEESGRSLSSTLKCAKDAVDKFGDPRQRRKVLRELNNVDRRIPTLGGAAWTDSADLRFSIRSLELWNQLDAAVLLAPSEF